MATITKKELVDRISHATGEKRGAVKQITQSFLDNIIVELGKGNRLEFRDFGVYEIKHRSARMAQNPRTLERVRVPAKRTVKFKAGRMMREALSDLSDLSDSPAEASRNGKPAARRGYSFSGASDGVAHQPGGG